MPKLQIKTLFTKAFTSYKASWKFLTLITLIAWLTRFIPSYLQDLFDTPWLFYSLSFLNWVLGIAVSLGLTKTILNLVDNQEKNLKNLYLYTLPLFIPFLLASIFYSLIVIAGTILLIIPGIILALKYQFFSYLIIDQNLTPKQAIKQSGIITQSHKLQLFWLMLLLILINLGGALFFLIGLIFTIPMSLLIMAYTYRELNPAKVASPTY
ncbi:MAG: hypothetical protein ABIJ43_00955 [Candidatus Beckwithbacteria bacterium]|nr:hypothetical protein [Patescibacteria group bacterium]